MDRFLKFVLPGIAVRAPVPAHPDSVVLRSQAMAKREADLWWQTRSHQFLGYDILIHIIPIDIHHHKYCTHFLLENPSESDS